MAKIQITESELKQIIRESVGNVLDEIENGNAFTNLTYTKQVPGTNMPPNLPAGYNLMTPDAQKNAVTQKNAAINSTLTWWNNLGTIGQIKEIQKLVGLTGKDVDGKIGPQTLAYIYRALKTDSELAQAEFKRGKQGVYNQPKWMRPGTASAQNK